LFINARTDVYLFGIGVPETRLDDVLARSSAYADAGADGLFVPGLTSLEIISELAKASPLPLNVMAGPSPPALPAPTAPRAGPAITQATYTLAQRTATELLSAGTYTQLQQALGFGAIDNLFARWS